MATIDKREGSTGTTYRVRVRVSGYPTKMKTFKRLTDAKEWAAETERAIKRGEFQNVIKEAKRVLLHDVIDRYKREILSAKAASTQRTEGSVVKWWDAQLGEYALSYIDSELISRKIAILSESGDTRGNGNKSKPKSPKTIKHYRDCIDQLFKYAKQWGYIGSNPVEGVNKVKRIRNARTRYLSDDERSRLMKTCKEAPNPYLYPMVVFALSTGARLGEITKLEMRDIDVNRSMAILRDTKNGETRAVPIVKHCKDVLLEHMETLDNFYKDKQNVTAKWLFPRADAQEPIDIRNAWENARDKAEIEDFRFHDLRHSAASYLAMNGATLLEIAAVLGHKTLQMVKRYSHLSEDHTKDIVEKMNSKIFD